MNEPFNPQEEVEKLCEEHKIFFTGKGNVTHENLISVGLGNLLYNQLSQFVDKKENNGCFDSLASHCALHSMCWINSKPKINLLNVLNMRGNAILSIT